MGWRVRSGWRNQLQSVPVALTDIERRQLRAIVEYLRPAQTHFVDLVEPHAPAPVDHWELGISYLGERTELR